MSNLFIVATPIGNSQDITLRALETLKTVDFILCEDTRVGQKLLKIYGFTKKLIGYHQHSSEAVAKNIFDLLLSGQNGALITDSGTPGISDPGNKLIAEIYQDFPQIKVIPIPGSSAVITLASVSGLPCDNFLFLGFAPHKKGRNKFFSEVNESKRTVIFYESVHRIVKALNELAQILDSERTVVVGRELTKKFETIYHGSISAVLAQIKADQIKGEFVVLVSGKK